MNKIAQYFEDLTIIKKQNKKLEVDGATAIELQAF